jgi:ribosomal protein S27AE
MKRYVGAQNFAPVTSILYVVEKARRCVQCGQAWKLVAHLER